MRRTIKVLIVTLLIVAVISPTVAMAATPQLPTSNAYISSFDNKMTATGGGQIKIEFETWGMGTVDKLGVSVISVYNQNGWVYTFSMSNPAYTDKMIGYDKLVFYGSVTYNGNAGDTYYAIVTHYAAKGTGSGTEILTTNSVVA